MPNSEASITHSKCNINQRVTEIIDCLYPTEHAQKALKIIF